MDDILRAQESRDEMERPMRDWGILRTKGILVCTGMYVVRYGENAVLR